jgi:hypothetical protein
MPAGNVVISGTFSQTPVASNELAILDVSVSSNTPELLSEKYNYTTKIPHIFPTVDDQKFSIIAIPEDPNADVSISLPGGGTLSDAGEEIQLNEGTSEYAIKVTSEGLEPKTYTFTVDYEPDLSLKSITLSSTQDETGEWAHTIPVQDGQTITIPYGSVTIAASPNDEAVTLNASASGNVKFTTDETDKWTLEYLDNSQDTYALYSTVKIKSTKNISNGGNYDKDFTLQFEKIVDADWPASFWATSTGEGNGVSIIKDTDGKYYEIHTFTVDGTLTVTGIPDEGLTARVLVVAGGGGGGNHSSYSDRGGAGGGGGVGYSESVSLTEQNYNVVVGGGGSGGSKGGDSSFGDITVEGGGKGGAGTSGDVEEAQKGGNGGSGGGGGAAGGSAYGIGGSANTHAAVTGYQFFGNNGDAGNNNNDPKNGTAGGNGGSANFFNDISGTSKEYGKGGIGGGLSGNTPAVNGTGNGGNGGLNSGSSGIVIVRFEAKPNPSSGDDE